MYGTSKKSVPEFGGSTPNLGETHEDGKVNTWEIGNTQNTHNSTRVHSKSQRETHKDGKKNTREIGNTKNTQGSTLYLREKQRWQGKATSIKTTAAEVFFPIAKSIEEMGQSKKILLVYTIHLNYRTNLKTFAASRRGCGPNKLILNLY